MKTHLLFVTVLFVSTLAFAQNSKIKPQNAAPINVAEKVKKLYSLNENSFTPQRINNNHQLQNQKNGTNPNVTVVSANRFSGSMNVYGLLTTQQKPLQYNKDVDIVTFAHRVSPFFTTSPVSNSGSIVFSWSLNHGNTWDSSCVWADATYLGRYPQGGIYNPPGNTNVNNIHFVATGPALDASSGQWAGGFFASKSYTDAVGGNPNALPSPNMQFYSTNSLGTKVSMPRNYFTYTNDGIVRVTDEYYHPINQTVRGMIIFKGTYSSGSFVWSADSLAFTPLVVNSSVNGPALFYVPFMAWDNSGTIGYAVMIGTRTGQSGTPKNGMQPIVYKTTNSGATWTLVPPFDFTTLYQLDTRLLFSTGSYTYAIPFFNPNEGMDVTVDALGRLHLVCTVVSAYSDQIDSLFYTYAFNSGGGCGAQNYSFYYGSTLHHPVIYDFILQNNNTWNGIIVDSMATEGTSGIDNTCSQWYASSLDINARIQVSRNDAGDKIFYSWTETDTTTTWHHFNVYPDLYAKGYDIFTNLVTSKTMVIGTSAPSPTVAGSGIFWHYMSPRIIDVGGGVYEIPLTFSGDPTFTGTNPVDHYYISGFQFSNADFLYPAKLLFVSTNYFEKNKTISSNVYPNPTNNKTQIEFNLNSISDIKVEITNGLGQAINTMNITNGQAGTHIVEVDLSDENAGVYFYTITTNSGKLSGKIVKQ
ncbi:MAG TPA: T9SS type A sorting domain-containing protein [Bacteroidia bacterium]|nr:T9SS type A sorting domain-containing protein [Bacteroidia bacterium]